jgi:hypothetical protein
METNKGSNENTEKFMETLTLLFLIIVLLFLFFKILFF